MSNTSVTDADIDRALNTHIPGGSIADHWFLPHKNERGNKNVRDVVRLILEGYAQSRQPSSEAVNSLEWLTDDGVVELVQGAGLDWHKGFGVDDEENRYASLVRAAFRLGIASATFNQQGNP